MELRTLRYLLAIADAGNITAAANTIHISQPALSRQMQDLETELGTKLFKRKHRAISLTANGTYLVNRARQILSLTDTAIADITDENIIGGNLAIGLGESHLNRIVLRAAKQLLIAYPGIQLQLYSGNADEITERLDQGLLDFGVVIDPADTYKYAFIKINGQNLWGLLIPTNDSLARSPSINTSQIVDQPLIVSERQPVVEMLQKWGGDHFSESQIVARYNLIYNAGLLAEAGFGYVVGISHLLDHEEMSLKFVPFSPKLATKMALIWTKNMPLSKAAQKFLMFFQQANKKAIPE
ncbi:LysR family transcriptional regulator [Lacticaseibacillus chiayiensis]|uniref:LysR family transcriptional regulator n=1 Tax=Lacticaseibacillus chiayiensis TaxID=2100821 RepID=UPI00101358DE|nr:LysR family transcriptional regulator [Lacticaseibacillus chiayiensis]RXT54971.1 LysR family transcriptional regulator [Lacticaseibacillus chiayiensis]